MADGTTNIDNNAWAELNLDETTLQNLLDRPLDQQDSSHLRESEHHTGFDNNVGGSWIYPNNLPLRSYQMNIAQSALYHNTLVVLPTGLGKTFIAAVIMYNFYRWYPRGKVIFLAPTRPLVHQQIEACQSIMPFPKKDTVELTGKLQRNKRTEMWRTKRVFFATPQVIQSDIFGSKVQAGDEGEEQSFQEHETSMSKLDFPFSQIKLIVIDEAHKAKGKYAYTEVVQAIGQRTKYFRVLALSATPGRTMEDVAEVCRNLFISHIEVRYDSSLDVLPYVHKRSIDTVVVSMGEKIKDIREQLLLIVDPYLRQLTEAEVLSGSVTNINRNYLLYEQKRFREHSLHMGRHPQYSTINSNFAISISIYHSLELLERHGLRVFLNNFEGEEDGKDKFVLQIDRRLRDLVESLKKDLGPNPFDVSAAPMTNGKIAEIPKDLDFGHPKFEKARECLLKHFENNKESRAIVFCEYRESVMLIYRLLLQHAPLLRPRCFVGQGGTTGSLRALTQKQQMQIMKDFRSSKSNILIATSIGEEGIDVGEVELIICFDISTSNPTRFVQRIGRTGRKKNGRVIMLVTEGRERQLLREVLANKDQTNKKLLKSSVVQQALYKHAPRLVPTEFKPKCIETYVKPPSDDEEPESLKIKKGPANKTKNTAKVSQDLRKFFNKKSKELDKEDLEYFEIDTNMTQTKPGLQTQQRIVNKLNKMENLFKDLQSPLATQTQKSNTSLHAKHNSSQGSIKDYFNDVKSKSQEIINVTQESGKDSFKDLSKSVVINLCDDESDQNPTNTIQDKSPIKKMDPERLRELQEFFKTTHTTPEVLKRAEINDLGYHLKSKEMSKSMKIILLKMRPEYIKENLEQMQVLTALEDNDISDVTEEEKSIREINAVILDLFEGLSNVEEFLQEVELHKFKEKCLKEDILSEEEDSDDMDEFRKKLDDIFEGLGDGKRHDNFDWIQERIKETGRYKEFMQSNTQTEGQESMIYDTFVDLEDESVVNNFEDYSITESKYCSQWQEFNKPDIVFKSTPLQDTNNKINEKATAVKRTSLLTKLEETKEEPKESNNVNISIDSKDIQDALELLNKKLKEHSLNEMASGNLPHDSLEDLENTLKTNRKQFEMRKKQNEEKFSSNNHFDEFNLPDEDELLRAAVDAELKHTQNIVNITPHLLNVTNGERSVEEILNSSSKLTLPSFNSTPDLELNNSNVKKIDTSKINSILPTSSEISLQQELDIDMEAFMEPFPEEQELMKNNLLSSKRESLINFDSSAVVRESPDLFSEDHMKSPIRRPIINKKPLLDSKLSTKENMQKCQSSLNLATSFKSPQKRLLSPKNPVDLLNSPSHLAIDKQKYEKSPSLFDMYLKSTKGKGKLPKSLSNTSNDLSSKVPASNKFNTAINKSPIISASHLDESLIVIRKSSKRKIFDSDSEDNEPPIEHLKDLSVIESKKCGDSDFKEITTIQGQDGGSIVHHRRKCRRYNSFIEQEAVLSGSEQSEDEVDDTIGCYMKDSIVVSSDDEDPDQASTSHMQAMYLQSLKSPKQRRGAFKIPAPRVYNDHSRIFSQAVLPNDIHSQYLPDSFVVHEDDSLVNADLDVTEVSICPLERAEKILKERRKYKKLGLLEKTCNKTKPKRKKKILFFEDSSEEENDIE